MSEHSGEPQAAVRESNWLSNAPIALFGCALGWLGLTLATLHVETAAQKHHVVSVGLLTITSAAFVTVLTIYVAKGVRFPAAVWADWRHPVRSNFFAIISGTLVLLGLAFIPFCEALALALWALGAIAQLGTILTMVGRWVGTERVDAATLTPVTFFPAVANALVSLGGTQLGFVEISWFFFSIGLVLWIVVLAMLMGRLMSLPAMPDRMAPALMIMIAPPSVLMMAYDRLSPEPDLALLRVFYYTALLFALVVVTQLPRLLRGNFALSWWAYSFPLAAFAVATLIVAERLDAIGLHYFGMVLYGLMACIVMALTWRTAKAVLSGEVFLPEG